MISECTTRILWASRVGVRDVRAAECHNGEATEVDAETVAGTRMTSPSTVQSEAQLNLNAFWPRVTEEVRKTPLDLKNQALPLARIKKIMKLDEDVKMISAEAPMLFAKAAEIFIHELTLRAWVHTEDNKRRTLQRNDIAMAISKCDQFDFLIDIVPREELKPAKAANEAARGATAMNPDQIQYYFQLAQQHQQALSQTGTTSNTNATTASSTAANTPSTIQIFQPSSGQIQTVQVANIASPADQQRHASTTAVATQSVQPQVIQVQQPQQAQVQQQTVQAATGGIQIVQQVVTPNGEIQSIPIQLTPQQMQMIRMQLQGNTQSAIIQVQPQLVQDTGLPTGC
ncbi:nuclear transcription factor Y subunit gamma-like isoform X3 [Frankliniella occidentalis]|uniref:Nuclear transcription factor Y subunit gamma n=1 Tax=Frankliniella occidentalis TaxID=133901 RepID=A0A9C6X8M1_FRAOC|nr:nuclear transcription factor Y subunit gamma-like isoform X3 [Frankliniella occidentalis]